MTQQCTDDYHRRMEEFLGRHRRKRPTGSFARCVNPAEVGRRVPHEHQSKPDRGGELAMGTNRRILPDA